MLAEPLFLFLSAGGMGFDASTVDSQQALFFDGWQLDDWMGRCTGAKSRRRRKPQALKQLSRA